MKEQKRLEELVKSIEREDLETNDDTNDNGDAHVEFLKRKNWRMKQAEQTAPRGKRKSARHYHGAWGDGQPFTVDYCHVYRSTRKRNLSSRLTQRAYEVGLQAIQRAEQENNPSLKQVMGRPSSRHRRTRAKHDKINSLTRPVALPLHSPMIWCQSFCDKYRPVFSGTCQRKAKGVKDESKQVILSATQDLVPLDSPHGLHIPGVFTLIPRSFSIAHYKEQGLQEEYNAMTFLEHNNTGNATKRSKKRKVFKESTRDGSTYVCSGVGCDRTKDAGLSQHLKGLDQDPNHHSTIGKFFRNVESQSSAWLSHHDLVFLNAVKKVTGHPGFDCGANNGRQRNPRQKIFSSMFPAIACGRNVYLNVHTDEDFFWSVTTVIQKDAGPLEMDSSICNYFCFPTHGVSVALRHGDILLFNPLIPHCISSRCDDTRDEFCISLYLKTAVVGGNDNKEFRGYNTKHAKPQDSKVAHTDH